MGLLLANPKHITPGNIILFLLCLALAANAIFGSVGQLISAVMAVLILLALLSNMRRPTGVSINPGPGGWGEHKLAISSAPPTGRNGVVTSQHGDAFYGNQHSYNPDLYYGRVSKGAKLLLMDDKVYKSNHNLPIIKVKVLDNEWESEIGRVGWVGLTDTSFADYYLSETQAINVHGQADDPPPPAVQPSPAPEAARLPDLLKRMRDFSAAIDDDFDRIILLGGEAVPELQKIVEDETDSLRETSLRLIDGIGERTMKWLGDQVDRHICARCLTHFEKHRVRLSHFKTVEYCGCRVCHQSRNYLTVKGQVIACLDSKSKSLPEQRDSNLVVNWLEQGQLFDFDAVEIRRAGDEEVERFAVQVQNDTDPWRDPGYRKMTCAVHKSCKLSDNTIRILEQTFGKVMVD